jgi:hypothetical protein
MGSRTRKARAVSITAKTVGNPRRACVREDRRLESRPLLVSLAGIGAVAGFTPRHPFDLIWNHAVRRLLDAPPLPPNAIRRPARLQDRDRLAAHCRCAVRRGATSPGAVAGGLLAAAGASATALNFCVPSFLLSRRNDAALQ